MVAHPAANGGEGVILFYKRESVFVSALSSHFQISLNCNVGGTGRFARRRSGVITIDSVFVAVFLFPLIFLPIQIFFERGLLGQGSPRIDNLTLLCT